MRVASVNQDPGISPGRAKGAAVHLEAMRAAFAERGDEVIAIDETEPLAVERALAAAAAERPLDLVYERYALGRAAAALFARAHGLAYVVEVNAPLAFEASLWRTRRDPCLDSRLESATGREQDRLLFDAASAVIAVSRAVADYAVERGAAPERIEVAPNAVDPVRFAPERRAEWGAESPVPGGRFVVGFHGRLRPWHGFELLAETCRELVARGVDLHLLVVGEGEFAAALDGRLAEERRTFVGWLPHGEVGRYVALFDVLPLTYPPGLPCYFSPLKLAEAMAAGAVPAVPAMGDLAELVGAGGIVYPPGDLDALSCEIERLAREPERREHLSRAAVATARARSWRSIADRVWERLPVGVVR